jgi:predicted Zn finger-like uncharacterized protein
MADTITIACPECDKPFAVRPETVGKKVRCKGCDHVFIVKAPGGAAKPPPAKAKAALDDDEEDSNPYGITDVKLGPRCPHCANALESEDTIVCLTCGYNVLTRQKAETRKVEDVTAGRKFVWLLPAFLCILFSIGLVVFDTIYCMKIENWLGGTKDDWYMNDKLHFALKLWLWIFSLGGIYLMCKYAFIRLVFHPSPPEIEVKMKARPGGARKDLPSRKARPKKKRKKVEDEDEDEDED